MNDSQHSSRWVEIHAQGTSIVRWEMARMKDGKAACAWMSRSALGRLLGVNPGSTNALRIISSALYPRVSVSSSVERGIK